jgi:prepilin peptidase CpaA
MTAFMVLALMLAIAVYVELKERRIPNWLTLSGMALGLLIAYLDHFFMLSIVGLLIGFGFLFIFYVFGGVGGGDVKLMGAAGALMGAHLIQPALVYTAFIGAFLAVMMLIWRKDFWMRIALGFKKLAFWRKESVTELEPPAPIAVPYGIAIALGCLLALLDGSAV